MYKKLPPVDSHPNAPKGTVYLLHFDRPYKHAQHYLGFAAGDEADVVRRLLQHDAATTNGARLLQVVRAAGISWTLARLWKSVTRYEERRLKNQGGLSRQCPICQGREPQLT